MMRTLLLLFLIPFFFVPCLAQDQPKHLDQAFYPSDFGTNTKAQPAKAQPADIAELVYLEGTSRLGKRDLATALICFERAQKLDPSNEEYPTAIKKVKQQLAGKFFRSAIHKQVKNDLLGAITDFQAALKLQDDPATHFYLSSAYRAVYTQGRQQSMPLDDRKPREDGHWNTPDGHMPDGFSGWSTRMMK